MQLVPVEEARTELTFAGVPLSVVFADGELIEEVRLRGTGSLPLEPPYHVSDDDAYLVMPTDIGVELIDIMRDGDHDLMQESMRDGLLVFGGIVRDENGDIELYAEHATTPAKVLKEGLDYAATVALVSGVDPLPEVNALPHVQCTIMSALLDDEGLDKVLRGREFLGTSWRAPASAADAGVDPTYVWARRGEDGVGVEMALYTEYEELVALIRPLKFVVG